MRYIRLLILRYLLILFSSLGGLAIFYLVFTPLTIYPSYWIFSLLGETMLLKNVILFNSNALEIVNACIAGSAYFFLFALSMSFGGISLLKRLEVLAYTFGSFLILNIIRIVFMGVLIGNSYFSVIHLTIWYIFSTLFVVLIWFSAIKIFKLTSIPFYSDFIFLKRLKFQKKK